MRQSNRVEMPDSEPTNRLWQTAPRWAAIVLSGPLLVFALIQVDWSFLPSSSGALELSAEFLVEELVISFKLTLLAIVSLSVSRVLCSQTRQTRDMAVLLPFYLWGLEATALDRAILFSSSWTPHFLLFLLWLLPVVTFSALALVLLSGMLHGCAREPHASERGARRIVQVGLRPAISAGVVVTTVLLDLLLLSVVMGESIASEIPS